LLTIISIAKAVWAILLLEGVPSRKVGASIVVVNNGTSTTELSSFANWLRSSKTM